MSTDTIGTGKDHTTIADWYAAIPTTLTEDETGLLANQDFLQTSTLNLDGKTPGSWEIFLKPDTGASFRDSKDDAGFKLRYDTTQGCAISTTGSYVYPLILSDVNITISELQISSSHTNTDGCLQNSADNNVMRDLIVYTTADNGVRAVSVLNGILVNSLVIMNSDDAWQGAKCDYHGSIIQCTIVAPSDAAFPIATGAAKADSSDTVKSTALFECTTASEAGAWDAASDYNATDAATVVGGNSQNSLTLTNQFEGTTISTMDYRLKSGSDLIGAGNIDASWPDDILGTVRATGTGGDCGCHEFVESATVIPNKIFQINQAVNRASYY